MPGRSCLRRRSEFPSGGLSAKAGFSATDATDFVPGLLRLQAEFVSAPMGRTVRTRHTSISNTSNSSLCASSRSISASISFIPALASPAACSNAIYFISAPARLRRSSAWPPRRSFHHSCVQSWFPSSTLQFFLFRSGYSKACTLRFPAKMVTREDRARRLRYRSLPGSIVRYPAG